MVLIVTALKAEARPLVDALGLKHSGQSADHVFYANGDIHLAVSGVGREKAASAVDELCSRVSLSETAVVLNVGICGSASADHEKGDLLFVDKVCEWGSDKVFASGNISGSQLRKAGVTTFDTAVSSDMIREESSVELVDMEASGFFESAVQHLPGERVYILKVVSDHLEKNPEISAAIVSSLIEKNVDKIVNFVRMKS